MTLGHEISDDATLASADIDERNPAEVAAPRIVFLFLVSRNQQRAYAAIPVSHHFVTAITFEEIEGHSICR